LATERLPGRTKKEKLFSMIPWAKILCQEKSSKKQQKGGNK
jgi:hypothetical protein